MFEELEHFWLAEHHREFHGAAQAGEGLLAPRHLQCDQIQELHSGKEGVDAFRRELLFLDQIELILADRFQVQPLRADVVELGEFGDIMDVAALLGCGESAQMHIFDEALWYWWHGMLLEK